MILDFLQFNISVYRIHYCILFDDHTISNKKTETVSGLIFENNERFLSDEDFQNFPIKI